MQEKKCSKCGEVKPVSEFYKRNDRITGYASKCKSCKNKSVDDYLKTKEGLVTVIYKGQRNSSRLRKKDYPTYSKEEFKFWLFSQPNFDDLYNNWVESGYDKWAKPSCDRLKDDKPYTLDNIQLTTWRYNNTKSHKGMMNGDLRNDYRPIVQLNMDGSYVTEYHSISEAARSVPKGSVANIISAARGDYRFSCGFKWKFKEDYYGNKS